MSLLKLVKLAGYLLYIVPVGFIVFMIGNFLDSEKIKNIALIITIITESILALVIAISFVLCIRGRLQ